MGLAYLPISWGGARGVNGAAYMAVPCVVSGCDFPAKPMQSEDAEDARERHRTGQEDMDRVVRNIGKGA